MKKGKLILVAGYFGSGKTTYITSAIKNISNLNYLLTYTTRPKRITEISGEGEYLFVDDKEYKNIKEQSKKWDEYIFNTYYYANDVSKINEELSLGKNFILCTLPNVSVINQMKNVYDADSVLVWVDTSLATSNERVIIDGRPERVNHAMQTEISGDETKKVADFIFTPDEDLEKNKIKFAELVGKILKNN